MFNFFNVLTFDWRIFGEPGLDYMQQGQLNINDAKVLAVEPLDIGIPPDPWMTDSFDFM